MSGGVFHRIGHPHPTINSTKKCSWCCPKHVHQLSLNELDAFTWEKANKKTIWIHTAVRASFSSCWIHPGHCRSIYNLIPLMGWNRPWRRWGMQIPDPWASLVLPDPGYSPATLHTLKERCDGSDWHISSQSIPVQLLASVMFPTPSTEPAPAPFSQSHVRVFSVCLGPTWFFASVSVCLSSQVLDKGTNYCGAPHHCM